MAIEFEARDEPVDGETHLVTVRGEIDLFTAPEFKQHINAAIETGSRRVVIDLCGATFIDSSSLGVLISANKRLRQRGDMLVISCDVREVLNTFSITGLDGVFTLVPTVEDAVGHEPEAEATTSA